MYQVFAELSDTQKGMLVKMDENTERNKISKELDKIQNQLDQTGNHIAGIDEDDLDSQFNLVYGFLRGH